MTRRWIRRVTAAFAVVALFSPKAFAQCTGGTPGSNGLIPVLTVSQPVAGQEVRVTVANVAPGATTVWVGFSLDAACRDVSARFGDGAWLWPALADVPAGDPPFSPLARLGVTSGTPTVTRTVPARWAGRQIYAQAFVADSGAVGGYALSGGNRFHVRDGGTSLPDVECRLGGFLTLPTPLASIGAVRDPRTGHFFLFGEEIVEIDPAAPFDGRIRTTLDKFSEPRSSVAAAWDPSRNVAVLFGGMSVATRTRVDDVYEFDPSMPEGSRLRATADRLPNPQSGGSAAWDPYDGAVYVFGGTSQNGHPGRHILRYDPTRAAGSRISTAPESLPTGASSPSAITDPSLTSILVFGASIESVFRFDTRRADGDRLSTFDSLSPARSGVAAARDDVSGRIYMFGGWNGFGYSSDVVEFDSSAPAGQRARVVCHLEEGQAFGSAIGDPVRRVIYALGGSNSGGTADRFLEFSPPTAVTRPLGGFPEDVVGSAVVYATTNDTVYVFGESIYEIDRLAPFGQEVRPTSDTFGEPRLATSAAWDPGRGVAYVFGGRNPVNGARTDEIWQFDPSRPEGTRFTLLPDRLPAARAGGSAVFDTKSGVAYHFGGTDASSRPTRTIYKFDPKASPGSRVSMISDTLLMASSSLSAVWDDGTHRAYLMADGTNWIYVFDPNAPAGSRIAVQGQLPSDRAGSATTLDPTLGVIFVVGGWNAGRAHLNEVVQFDPTAPEGSRVRIVDYMPKGRGFATATFDRYRGEVLIVGGDSSGNDIRTLQSVP